MHLKSITSLVVILSAFSVSLSAAPVSGQGTWETSLLSRDLDGNASTIEAYYDTILNVTWLANANAGAGSSFDDGFNASDGQMTWSNAMAWAASLDINGIDGWRLPTLSPIDGATFDTNFSNNASTDFGYADGTGWIDTNGNPVSELGHMFYVNLGNPGFCARNDLDPNVCSSENDPYGLTNTGMFTNLLASPPYWTDTAMGNTVWIFHNVFGDQTFEDASNEFFAWAVHSGDVGSAPVSAVPIPTAVWLFGSGLTVLFSCARRKANPSAHNSG